MCAELESVKQILEGGFISVCGDEVVVGSSVTYPCISLQYSLGA